MIQDKSERKKLDLSRRKLGIRLPKKSLSSPGSSNKNKDTIVVVTKVKSSGAFKSDNNKSKLTFEEKESRLKAVLDAEKMKALNIQDDRLHTCESKFSSKLKNETVEITDKDQDRSEIKNLDHFVKDHKSNQTGATNTLVNEGNDKILGKARDIIQVEKKSLGLEEDIKDLRRKRENKKKKVD